MLLPTKVVREYVEQEQSDRFSDLMETWGNNKELPEGYELQTLLALSHYPELKDTRIKFILDDVDIPLSSRPFWASMHRSAKKRTYLVVIDSNREGVRDALLLENQPFNAQTGIIGHELAHTVYYLDRSFLAIMSDALCQLSSCRVNFERATDRRLIDYGLGWQRYDHSVYVRRSRGIDPNVPSNPNSPYMSPIELLNLMTEHPAYQFSMVQR